MKRYSLSALLTAVALVFALAANATVIDLLGDKDGFGVGVPIGDGYNYTDYGSFWADNRDPGDAAFTDIWGYGDKSWTHTYTALGPVSATLEFFVAGIADYTTWSADVFVDGSLVGTIPGTTGAHDLTRLVSFDLGVLDGITDVSIKVSDWSDGYIIDYSELRTSRVPVPEPTVLLLLSAGLLGVAVARRRKA